MRTRQIRTPSVDSCVSKACPYRRASTGLSQGRGLIGGRAAECQPFVCVIGPNMDGSETRKRRRELRWSKEARDLVRANSKAGGSELSALVDRLVEEAGHPRWACWRFLLRVGVRAGRPQPPWTKAERPRLITV